MEKQREIKCDCGGVFQEKEIVFEGFQTKAMSCSKCKEITFTKKQAQDYVKLKKLQTIIDKERTIIKIGNSMGITLPEQLKEYGLTIGKKIKLEALNQNSIKIEF